MKPSPATPLGERSAGPAPGADGAHSPNGKSPFWLEETERLLQALGSRREGLTTAEAERSRTRYGPNRLQGAERFSALRQLLGTFSNPLVLILLLASGASAAAGELVNAGLIAALVLFSAALDFTQSFRSGRAAERLRQSVATSASVLRDGQRRNVPLDAVVPGDVVFLCAGSLVPGDGRLLDARDLHVNEAALTGESLPAEKRVGDLPPAATTPVDARNAVFMGTSVMSGTGTVLIVATGLHTEFGRTSEHLRDRSGPTEFERGTRSFGVLIARTVIFLVLFVFLTNVLFHRRPLESFLFAVALAVGLTPEFLPMIMTVSLAAGAVRMARSRVIVKRLVSIENLGSIDILCSDKTGTLTEGCIVLERHVDLDGADDPRTLHYAVVNSTFESGLRSPMDDAILAHDHPPVQQYRKVDEVPFDFERRRVSVAVDGPDGRELVLKGAPESVAPVCTHYLTGPERVPFDEAARTRWRRTFEDLSADGYRVLAVARGEVPARERYGVGDEVGLTFVGFAAFLDPPRGGVGETLAALRRDGVRVKIISGDNELVTRKICAEVGLEVEGMLLGAEVDRLGDAALGPVAERTTIFARVSPEQKNRIIHALRGRGHVVGYVGDGINDAPSLRSADIGISVANGVDVAKEAADIILLDKSLEAVHQGVLEGRRSFSNILKYILMGTSSNFGNMFSMAGASVLLPFLPLLPTQVLLNNFLYDLSQVPLPGDQVEAAYLRKPRRWNVRLIQDFMLVLGPVSSLYDFLTFAALLFLFHASPSLFRTGWFVESLATQVLVIFVIRTPGNPLRSRPSPALTFAAVGVVLIGLLLPFTPLAAALDFVALPAAFPLFLLVVVPSYLLLVEGIKRRFYRKHGLT